MPEGQEMFGRFDAMLRYLDEGMDAYVQWREAHGVTWPAAFRKRMLANDADALRNYIQATPDHFPLSFSSSMTMPVLVFSGDDDELMAGSQARRAAAEIPDGRYLEIADADHPALYLDSARAAPHVAAFFHEKAALPLPSAR
jgi:pimeloyl-ACP methyl ester carboxylesterase